MKRFFLVAMLLLTGCAAGTVSQGAPEPLKPIDPARFFTGRWYEMARTPMSLTNGCVAGTTDFFIRTDGVLEERDACRKGSPEGPEKVFEGPVSVLNPGENTEFTVHYVFYGVIPLVATYWVLDRADDYSWFIVSTPSFHNVAILDRDPRPSAAALAAITARLTAMGYDESKLEFPPHFPQ